MKEDMSKKTTEFIAKFLDELSGEGLIHGSPPQYRRGYPNATDDELQLLNDAGKKAGAVPHNLEHARLIVSDNVYAFPARGTKRFAAFDHWPVPDVRTYPAAGLLVMSRVMQEFATRRPDGPPDLLAAAVDLEQRALAAIKAGLSELSLDATVPKQETAPTVWRERDAAQRKKAKPRTASAAMLALARAMQVLAGKDLMDDPDLMRDAIELEKRADIPTAKDFEDAALAVQSARLQHKALDEMKLVGRREAGGIAVA
jgi:hypothetical protein